MLSVTGFVSLDKNVNITSKNCQGKQQKKQGQISNLGKFKINLSYFFEIRSGGGAGVKNM